MLDADAPAVCREADVSNVFFDLEHAGGALSVRTNSGEMFQAPVNVDGHVKTTVTVPLGKRTLAVDLSGNVTTREMEVFNAQYSCRFKLIPA